jgi:uncharacterized membrane protein
LYHSRQFQQRNDEKNSKTFGFMNTSNNSRAMSLGQKWKLPLLVLFYLAAGLNHFISPGFYLPLIPPYFPEKELLNSLSGIIEILLAIGAAIPFTRRYAAYSIVAMLLAFVPAHIWFIQQGGCVDPAGLCVPGWVAWVRLIAVHPLLIWWALASAGGKQAKE